MSDGGGFKVKGNNCVVEGNDDDRDSSTVASDQWSTGYLEKPRGVFHRNLEKSLNFSESTVHLV